MTKRQAISMLLIVAAGLGGRPAPARADASTEICWSLVRLAGMTSLAQLRCGIAQFDAAVRSDMRHCADNFSPTQQQEAFFQGYTAFETLEKRQGHATACATMLRTYPKILTR